MPRPRTSEEKDYHAERERTYRKQKKNECDAAIARLAESASTLVKRHKYTPGQLVDILLEAIKVD